MLTTILKDFLTSNKLITFIHNQFIAAINVKVCHVDNDSVVWLCVKCPFTLGITGVTLQDSLNE